jgi:predicted lipoprotein with Yx(FWY)xxD motif
MNLKRFLRRGGVATSLSAAVLLAAAGFGYSGHTMAAAPSLTVKTSKVAQFGKILTNSKGMALYILTGDKAGKPTCGSGCSEYWPAALLPQGQQLKNSKLPGKLGTVHAIGGGRQITYNGWPLYTYIADKQPGQVTGNKVPQSGDGVWYVATVKTKTRPSF